MLFSSHVQALLLFLFRLRRRRVPMRFPRITSTFHVGGDQLPTVLVIPNYAFYISSDFIGFTLRFRLLL